MVQSKKEIMRAYHGSRINFQSFEDRRTFFTAHYDVAEGFAKPEDDEDLEGHAQIHVVDLSILNPKIFDDASDMKFLDESDADLDIEEMIEDGFDSAMSLDGMYILVFSLSQVNFLTTKSI